MCNVEAGRIYQQVGVTRFVRVLAVWPAESDSDEVLRATDIEEVDRSAKIGCATIVTWDRVRQAPTGRATFAKLTRFHGKFGGYRLVEDGGQQ